VRWSLAVCLICWCWVSVVGVVSLVVDFLDLEDFLGLVSVERDRLRIDFGNGVVVVVRYGFVTMDIGWRMGWMPLGRREIRGIILRTDDIVNLLSCLDCF